MERAAAELSVEQGRRRVTEGQRDRGTCGSQECRGGGARGRGMGLVLSAARGVRVPWVGSPHHPQASSMPPRDPPGPLLAAAPGP